MTATKVAPPCSGKFRTRCRVCGQPTHPSTTEGPNRMCDQGHRPYVGKGRCRQCYRRDQKTGRLPQHSPVERPPRRRRQRTPGVYTTPLPASWTPIPRARRATTPSWCSRCNQPGYLPLGGPAEALCVDCDHAQLLDMASLLRAGDAAELIHHAYPHLTAAQLRVLDQLRRDPDDQPSEPREGT